MPEPLYTRLTMLDNSFLAMEGSNTHMHVASTILFDAGPLARPDGGIDADRIRSYVRSRLHLIPRYRQRLAAIPIERHPVWVDDDHFNIHYHVRHTSLPRPGDVRQLKRLSARIMSQQLDRAKPLWEIWIVEGFEEGKRFALVSKTHHCMIDGISGADLISVLLGVTPDQEFEDAGEWSPRPAPSAAALLRDEVIRRARAPLAMLEHLPSAVRAPRMALAGLRESVTAVRETLAAQLGSAPPTPLNEPIGPHRRFDWLAMDLADLKEVKDQLGGSLNDVVLATVAGALRRFLEHRRTSVGDLEFRAFVPVSVRSRQERGTLGNRVAAWMAVLPVAEADPRRRLAKVTEVTTRLKESKQALGAEILSAVSEWSSSTLLSLALQLAGRVPPFNLVVTNVPGPQLPLYLLGARLLECYPMVPLYVNQGLGIALFSYAGRIYWGFNADYDLLPDLHDFVEAIEASFGELQKAARAEGAPGAARPRRVASTRRRAKKKAPARE